MSELNVDLHPAQLEIFHSKARFKVVSAGRRFGKSRLAAWILLIQALQSKAKDVFYIGPTFQQAKDIMWGMLKEQGRDIIAHTYENTAQLTLINGRKIYLKSADRPDTLRGVGLAYVVLDEYASMKPIVWEQIIRPTLADVQGGALFIGTPSGKNHFYELYRDAEDLDDWENFSYTTLDNPYILSTEIEAAKISMSSMAYRQEFEASFETFTGAIFKTEWFKKALEPKEGITIIAVDPAGFEDVEKDPGGKKSRLDETAIAIVKVERDKWWVRDILHGRWGVKQTASRILKAAVDSHATTVGIEGGSLRHAILPYLADEMATSNRYLHLIELKHGGRKKIERITWALQGRMEHGQITFNPDVEWQTFINQMIDFPTRLSHDDLLDALAYIDQATMADFSHTVELDEDWEPSDLVAGY
jgi:phage terminase large subunit-like protein